MKMPGKSVFRFAPPILSVLLAGLVITGLTFADDYVPLRNPIAVLFAIQGIAVVAALLVIVIIYLVRRRRLEFLRLGSFTTPARPIRLLGVESGDTWRHIFVTYGLLILVVTAILLYVAYGSQFERPSWQQWGMGILFALGLAALQTFASTLVIRWSIAETFNVSRRLATFAPYVAALLVIYPSFYGAPGGFLGAGLAVFTAWLTTRSIQDTAGLGWALTLGWLQNMLILSVVLTLIQL